MAEVPVDLEAWLTAQFDADEAVARAATRGAWELVDVEDGDGFEIRSDQSPTGRPRTEFRWVSNHVYDRPDAEHIARWGPARVLAEVAGKRRRLALHHAVAVPYDDRHGAQGIEWGCAECGPGEPGSWPCETILTDAAPYVGRPGWLDEWAIA